MSHPVPNNPIAPIPQAERLQILDALRGFAVFGILAVNIGGFAAPALFPGYIPAKPAGSDELAEILMLFLAEGKFYTIFSFLFGLGFSVQMTRAEAKGKDLRSFYPRRLLVLFALGVLHAVIFWLGDILRLYAMLGFLLLAFRKRSDKTLLAYAGIFLVIGFILLAIIGGPHLGGEKIPGLDILAMARQAYRGDSFSSVVAFQFFGAFFSFLAIAFTQSGTVMALFLLGLLAGRMKLFERTNERRSFFTKVIQWGLPVGLIFNALFILTEAPWLSSLGFTIGAPAFAAVYISGLALLSLRPFGAKLLAPVAKVGRMALTNYVLQSVVCSLLFNGYGFGLYESVGAARLWGFTFAIYLCQIPLSVWWLSRFQFGPLEWLWRSLTYGKRQPFLIDK